jgi:hypothetical protein
MASVFGVTAYDVLNAAGPLVGPQSEEPVRVALTFTVAVSVVATSLSVMTAPVVCGPSMSTLQTPATLVVHVKPELRFTVPDVPPRLRSATQLMVPEQVTVAARPLMLQLPEKATLRSRFVAAGFFVVPDAVPVLHFTAAAPYVSVGFAAVPDTLVATGVIVPCFIDVSVTFMSSVFVSGVSV